MAATLASRVEKASITGNGLSYISNELSYRYSSKAHGLMVDALSRYFIDAFVDDEFDIALVLKNPRSAINRFSAMEKAFKKRVKRSKIERIIKEVFEVKKRIYNSLDNGQYSDPGVGYKMLDYLCCVTLAFELFLEQDVKLDGKEEYCPKSNWWYENPHLMRSINISEDPN